MADEPGQISSGRFSGFYKSAGILSLIAGVLSLVSLALTTTIIAAYEASSLTDQLQFASQRPLTGIIHGLGVLTLILVVPVVMAIFVRYRDQRPTLAYLGLGYGLLWLTLGLVGHLIRTSPLKELSHAFAAASADQTSSIPTIYLFASELWTALTRTSGVFAALAWLFFGRALITSAGKAYIVAGWLGQVNIAFYIVALGTGALGLAIQNGALGLTWLVLGVGLIKDERRRAKFIK
jgi:hypothetical protein